MVRKVFSHPDIYLIEMPLQGNPLKSVNAYIVKSREKSLIVDTGLNTPESLHAFKEGIHDLSIDPKRTDIFLTHCHPDHAELAYTLGNTFSTVAISRQEYLFSLRKTSESYFFQLMKRSKDEGFPIQEISQFYRPKAGRKKDFLKAGNLRLLDGHSKMRIGSYEWTCISTPGHTPGHMCLYLPERQLMMTGDHVLFAISPVIGFMPGIRDPLGNYLQSLYNLKKMVIQFAFPGHGNSGMPATERINQLIKHHQKRLNEIERLTFEWPHANSYELAGKVNWSTGGVAWEQLSPGQRWMAFTETVAHLDHLVCGHRIQRQ